MLHTWKFSHMSVLCAAIMSFLAVAVELSPALAACGGDGQSICTTAGADKKNSLVSCNKKGEFPDWISGQCWTCPNGTIRNLKVGTTKNACTGAPTKVKALGHAFHGWKDLGVCQNTVQVGKRCWACPIGWSNNSGNPGGWPSSSACYQWRTVIPTRDATKVGNTACASDQKPDGLNCYACPSGYGWTALVAAGKPNACTAKLPCHSGDIDIGKKCYKKGVCGKVNERACTLADRIIPGCDKGAVEVKGQCVKEGACGALNERACFITERFPSCNKGLAEDFLTGKCVAPASPQAVCFKVMSAIQKGVHIPLFDRLNAAKNRLVNLVAQKSGAAKIIDTLEKKVGSTLDLNQYSGLYEELGRMGALINAKKAQIESALLAPRPLCYDTAAQRLAKIEKLDLIPSKFAGSSRNFATAAQSPAKIEKPGVAPSIAVGSDHNPTVDWGIIVSYSAATPKGKYSITVETLFHGKLPVAMVTKFGVGFTIHKNTEAVVGINLYNGVEKLSAFSPAGGVNLPVPVSSALKFSKKMAGKLKRYWKGLVEPDGTPAKESHGFEIMLRLPLGSIGRIHTPIPDWPRGIGILYTYTEEADPTAKTWIPQPALIGVPIIWKF
ncbi:MAG: hypothetical protein HN578_12810 [Rhodospirillales bacterium]|nr:hypothetical protein [Rhodospirillales bacterium]